MHITPYVLELVIHHHCSYDLFPRWEAPLYNPTIDELIAEGILERGDDGAPYHTTEKGKAWIEMLLATPFPEQKWIDPRKKQST